MHILLYYLELGPHFGGEKKRKAKQTNGDPLFCDDAVMIKFEAFFETAVLGINQSMCQSGVPLTFCKYCPTVLSHMWQNMVWFFFFFFESGFLRPFGLKSFTSWCLLCDAPC